MNTSHIDRDRALSLVFDAYTTGLPETTAVQLTGRSAAWVHAQYVSLRRRGISTMAGQMSLFDTGPA